MSIVSIIRAAFDRHGRVAASAFSRAAAGQGSSNILVRSIRLVFALAVLILALAIIIPLALIALVIVFLVGTILAIAAFAQRTIRRLTGDNGLLDQRRNVRVIRSEDRPNE
jgi:cobalamin synthase